MQKVTGDSSAETASVVFESVDAGFLPPGRACLVIERPARLDLHVAAEHASPGLLAQLASQHQVLLDQGRWRQHRGWYADRIDEPPQGRQIAHASWHLIAGDELPVGVLCASVEQRGSIVWLLHDGHATQQLCDEVNAAAKRIVGDGLWRQCWPD